jgi:hypothetical protein
MSVLHLLFWIMKDRKPFTWKVVVGGGRKKASQNFHGKQKWRRTNQESRDSSVGAARKPGKTKPIWDSVGPEGPSSPHSNQNRPGRRTRAKRTTTRPKEPHKVAVSPARTLDDGVASPRPPRAELHESARTLPAALGRQLTALGSASQSTCSNFHHRSARTSEHGSQPPRHAPTPALPARSLPSAPAPSYHLLGEHFVPLVEAQILASAVPGAVRRLCR